MGLVESAKEHNMRRIQIGNICMCSTNSFHYSNSDEYSKGKVLEHLETLRKVKHPINCYGKVRDIRGLNK